VSLFFSFRPHPCPALFPYTTLFRSMTVLPGGPPVMPKFLGMWFVYCLIIGFFVAYLTGRTVAPGAHYLAVFRVAGTAAFLAYGLGHLSNGIWKGQPWSVTFKEVIDGLV